MGKQLYLIILGFALSLKLFAVDVAYLTDVEGSYEKLMRYISRSPAFQHNGDFVYHLKPGAHFVYGGDATDRAPGARKILTELIRLKRESPQAVTLLVGNRDLTYVRLRDILDNFKAPPPGKRVPYFIATRMEELGAELGIPADQIPYDDARNHLKQDLIEGGLWPEYLTLSDMVYRIGNTLFVHGAITEASLGWNPLTGKDEPDLDKWIMAMNSWFSRNIVKWRSGQPYDGQVFENDEETLTDVQFSPLKIIFDRNVGDFNNPFLPSEATIKRLLKAGIQRVVVGHTPMDQFPVTVRYQDSFEVIYADNSFAPNERNAHGIYISGKNMELVGMEVRNDGKIAGVPSDVNFILQLGLGSPIGKRMAAGSLVIAPVGQNFLTFQLGAKFSTHYKIITPQQAQNGTDPFEITRSAQGCGESIAQ